MSSQIPMFDLVVDEEGSGLKYERRVHMHLVDAFAGKSIAVYDNVRLGRSLLEKRRHLDLLLHHVPSNKALAIECKYQAVQGTAEEKLPYALADAAAMSIPCVVAWDGDGFSAGVQQLLRDSFESAKLTTGEFNEP